MAITWKPAIYKNSTLVQLPRPVRELQYGIAWDFRQSKIPLLDGQSSVGHSKNGRTVSISGEFAIQAGTPKLTEEDMFNLMTTFEALLDVSQASDKYEFFSHHDATLGTYRKLKNCFPTRLTTSFGDGDRIAFTYAAEIMSEDSTIYTTAPGA